MTHCVTMKQLAIALAIFSLAIAWMSRISTAQSVEEGVANYYSNKFHGKKTASGETYDKDGLTAAHKEHPYGTKLRVTNLENKKSVVVTVNDRMQTANPVVIDVTYRVAQELGFAKSGRARVKVEVQ